MPGTRTDRAPVAAVREPVPSITAWRAAFLFLCIAAVAFVVAGLSAGHLSYSGTDLHTNVFPGRPWLTAWVHWDARWYGDIADRGYWTYSPAQQGPLAFFPAYPILMHL